jgi:hypothetical protein
MTKKYNVSSLIKDYKSTNKPKIIENKYINFPSIKNKDVYNPAFPLKLGNKKILPARVESRDNEQSKIILFEQDGNNLTWKPSVGFQSLPLQDPFWVIDKSSLLLGGVSVDFSNENKALNWKTVIYRVTKDGKFTPFFTGPNKMKDLRFCVLDNGKIAVFTRPQGGTEALRGQIGFILLNSWKELTNEAITQAPLLDIFEPEEWGGVNQAQVLPDGNIGILGHIACYSDNIIKHYYPITFIFDPYTAQIIKEPKIILDRKHLLAGPSKHHELEDIIFPGGAIQEDEGTTLYLGVSDSTVQRVKTENIFLI